MYYRLHTAVGQVTLQFVAPSAEHGEYVVYTIGAEVRTWQQQFRVAYFAYITHGDAPARGVVAVKIFQLDAQHGSLQLVQATVTPLHVEHILAARPVVAQSTHGTSQLSVVRGHGSGIAESAEVLARIEAVPGRVAKAAGALAAKSTAVSLRVVLD